MIAALNKALGWRRRTYSDFYGRRRTETDTDVVLRKIGGVFSAVLYAVALMIAIPVIAVLLLVLIATHLAIPLAVGIAVYFVFRKRA